VLNIINSCLTFKIDDRILVLTIETAPINQGMILFTTVVFLKEIFHLCLSINWKLVLKIGRKSMNAVKQSYTDIPETISIPKEFIHQKGEIIIMMDEPSQLKSEKNLKDFFGSIPDFPERFPQGEYEERENL